jgi:hypothetical protein
VAVTGGTGRAVACISGDFPWPVERTLPPTSDAANERRSGTWRRQTYRLPRDKARETAKEWFERRLISMPDLTQLAVYLLAALVLAVTPGPGIFYVAARTLAAELLPGVQVFALLVKPTNPALAESQTQALLAAAQRYGLELHKRVARRIRSNRS